MRNLIEWRDAAKGEEEDHLLAFNHDRYVDRILTGSLRDPEISEAYRRFNDFLASSPVPYASTTKALLEFSMGEIVEIDSTGSSYLHAAAFAGIETSGVENFCAIKSLNFLKDNMDAVGYEAVIPKDVATELVSIVDAESYSQKPSDQFNAKAKRRINDRLLSFLKMKSIPAGTPSVVGSRTGTPIGRTITPIATTFDDRPMWLTSKDAIETHHSGEPPDQSDDALILSAYAAGLKSDLGLFDPAEGLRDRDRASPIASASPHHPAFASFEAMVLFGIVFLLEIDLTGRPKPLQPCIFSLGYDKLFLSRPRTGRASISMDGRTVRLRNTRRHDHGPDCTCGMPGLPEAVLPAKQAMERGATVLMHTMIFGTDLHFCYPECSMIRSKNA